MKPRLIFDILTLARVSGQPDGIARTVRALAQYAAAHRSDTLFAIYDLEIDALRTIKPRWLPAILDGAKIDTSHFPDRRSPRRRLRQRLPRPLNRVMLAAQRPRRIAFLALERMRLQAQRPQPWLLRLQDKIMSPKYRAELGVDGQRKALIPYEMAVGAPIELRGDDIVVETGSDWPALEAITRSLQESHARLVVLCYDIIPLLFPQFFLEATAKSFSQCFRTLFPASSLMIFNAHRVADDAKAYCDAHRLAIGKTAIVPLGTDLHSKEQSSDTTLPHGLMAGQYALYVSTIEPRKNHRLLYAVWKRLLAEGIPQRHSFKLIFVGRAGWKVDDLLAELKADPSIGETLAMLSGIDDALLAALYANAAFCVYPSFYEGFGLPVIESFANGKAMIASNGGALAETVGNLSLCLDPTDENAWFAALKQWIVEPQSRQGFESAIKSHFRQRSWNEAAREFFAAIERELISTRS